MLIDLCFERKIYKNGLLIYKLFYGLYNLKVSYFYDVICFILVGGILI